MAPSRTSSGKHWRMRRQLVRRGMPCAECGRPVTTHDKALDTHAELDHIVPVKLGGKDERSNYQVLCRRCNRRKGSKAPVRQPRTSQVW